MRQSLVLGMVEIEAEEAAPKPLTCGHTSHMCVCISHICRDEILDQEQDQVRRILSIAIPSSMVTASSNLYVVLCSSSYTYSSPGPAPPQPGPQGHSGHTGLTCPQSTASLSSLAQGSWTAP
jgi:hypothetical protein